MPTACVFAPAPLITVTVEQSPDERDEVHVHAGGQGFWIARLVAELGVDVVLCSSFGGETGTVAHALIEREERLTVRSVTASGANGAYVHDRRSGRREQLAAMPPSQLSRHELDELYGLALVEGLEADVTVLGGPGIDPMLPAEVYRRLAVDLTANGKTVVADLSGDPLTEAVAGGATVVKVSHEELVGDGRALGDSVDELVEGMRTLDGAGRRVVCTRADKPALALFDRRCVAVTAPVVDPKDNRGAGDSLTAGITAGLARGVPFEAALRLGIAAGGLNVTRRGLGTGNREEIEKLADHVEIEDLATATI